MSCFCNPAPTVVTGNTYPEFQAALAALVPTYNGHWTAVGPLIVQNGVYSQPFKQLFPVHGTQFAAYGPRPNYNCGLLAPQRNWWR